MNHEMNEPNEVFFESVTTRRLTIVDEVGKPRIVMSTDSFSDSQDVSTIQFLNKSGSTRLVLELVNDGVRIFVVPTSSSPGMEIRVDDVACGIGIGGCSGEGSTAFLGQNPVPAMSNSPYRRGQGYLFVRDVSSGNQINIPEPD